MSLDAMSDEVAKEMAERAAGEGARKEDEEMYKTQEEFQAAVKEVLSEELPGAIKDALGESVKDAVTAALEPVNTKMAEIEATVGAEKAPKPTVTEPATDETAKEAIESVAASVQALTEKVEGMAKKWDNSVSILPSVDDDPAPNQSQGGSGQLVFSGIFAQGSKARAPRGQAAKE
jgi:tetrahydromethanopterin S-methyltransferase subunit B